MKQREAYKDYLNNMGKGTLHHDALLYLIVYIMHYRGVLSELKTVLFHFDPEGIVIVSKESLKEDSDLIEVAIEIGADDVEANEEGVCFYCDHNVTYTHTDMLCNLNNLSSPLNKFQRSTGPFWHHVLKHIIMMIHFV